MIRRPICFCWGLCCTTTTTETTLNSLNSQGRAIRLASSDSKGISEPASSPLFLWFHFCMTFPLLLKAMLRKEANETTASCFFEQTVAACGICVFSGVVSAVSCRCSWCCVEDNKRGLWASGLGMNGVFILFFCFPKPKLDFCAHQSFAPKTLWELSRQ